MTFHSFKYWKSILEHVEIVNETQPRTHTCLLTAIFLTSYVTAWNPPSSDNNDSVPVDAHNTSSRGKYIDGLLWLWIYLLLIEPTWNCIRLFGVKNIHPESDEGAQTLSDQWNTPDYRNRFRKGTPHIVFGMQHKPIAQFLLNFLERRLRRLNEGEKIRINRFWTFRHNKRYSVQPVVGSRYHSITTIRFAWASDACCLFLSDSYTSECVCATHQRINLEYILTEHGVSGYSTRASTQVKSRWGTCNWWTISTDFIFNLFTLPKTIRFPLSIVAKCLEPLIHLNRKLLFHSRHISIQSLNVSSSTSIFPQLIAA